MNVREKRWIRFRIYTVAVFFVLGLGVVLCRAYQLQVLDKDRLAAIAHEGYVGTIKLPPKRGTIYEREGHELAISVELASVYAHPRRVKDKAATARALARILGESPGKILGRLKRRRSFVWISRKIDPEKGKRIDALELKGVGVTTETGRFYPGKEIAAHLIGFVGSENQGLEGIERKYDALLKGSERRLIQMHDALGRLFSISRPDPSGRPLHGLVLTIDKDIQYKAQQALRAAVKKARARAGHCLVVNPDTGEVLAMAVVPEFDPNAFSKYRPYQWRNRVVTDCFEPGSTMKAFLLSACLEESVVTPHTNFDCEQGRFRVGGRVIRDTHKNGLLSVSDIIVRSSNIGAVKLGEKLGYPIYYAYLKKFGFGRKTGIDLLGERSGFVRPPARAKTIDRATACFGQGMTVTSLQLVMAMAAIANGGRLMRPYVIREVVDESGKVIRKTYPKMVRRVLSPRTARKVAGILEGVVSGEGTGVQAAIRGFRVAGKTGTAQKVDPETGTYSSTKDVATFVGFVPALRPRLVILVMVDEPKGIPYGGVVAGPVFSEVGLWALNHLRINPDIRVVEQAEDGRADDREPSPAVRRARVKIGDGLVPDFRGMGMRAVLRTGRALGLRMRLKGSGLAVGQRPAPGSPIDRALTVRVVFRPPA